MNYNKFLTTFVFLSGFCSAQNLFELTNVSKNLSVIVNIENCVENKCVGKASLEVYDKATMKKYQTLFSDKFYLNLDENKKPAVDSLKNSVVLDDFNFDGTEDVAVRNGNSQDVNPFFEVYLNVDSTHQFVLNEELSNLVRSNSGMFTIDAERKLIISYLKNGCCWNLTSEYEYVPERGLLKVSEFEVDTRNSEKVKTVKREFIDYKWFSKTTIYPRELYFKEEKE